MERVFVSWSGGKDSCLAGYLATMSGLKISYLANTVSEDGKWSRSHGMTSDIIKMQSEAIEIPLVQQPVTDEGYEAGFKKMISALKEEGIEGGVFGDIDFNEHREWIERVCRDMDVIPHLPLWGKSQDQIMRDFVNLGFEAVVVATRADLLGEEWLGRKVDSDFIMDLEELSKTKQITLCGEAGEYHTVVIYGPLFQQRIEIMETDRVLRGNNWFLEILKSELRER